MNMQTTINTGFDITQKLYDRNEQGLNLITYLENGSLIICTLIIAT